MIVVVYTVQIINSAKKTCSRYRMGLGRSPSRYMYANQLVRLDTPNAGNSSSKNKITPATVRMASVSMYVRGTSSSCCLMPYTTKYAMAVATSPMNVKSPVKMVE